MEINYKQIKDFDRFELKSLYQSIGWKYEDDTGKRQISLENLHNVFSAWDKDKLIGLISCLSDGRYTVYINNLLVRPEYQRMGIGTKLINMVLDEYKNYKNILVIAENTAIGFYTRLGFEKGNDVTPMKINLNNNR